MAKLFEGGFDSTEVDPDAGFDAIPAGNYLAVITASEWKTTKNADGRYLKLTFQLLEGQFKGRNLWVNLNLENKSEQAVNIAKANLSAICRAVGVPHPKDSQELHTLPMVLKVKQKIREDNGELSNEVRGFLAKGKAGKKEEPAEQAATGKPPWQK